MSSHMRLCHCSVKGKIPHCASPKEVPCLRVMPLSCTFTNISSGANYACSAVW